ncbi:hypothetical protein L1887_23393 [Cichorium endivia]|nr:hypothetical protein L1887_23393 [Cichorium endivia]
MILNLNPEAIFTLEHEKDKKTLDRLSALCISHSSPVLEPCGCGCASALSPQASPLLHATATATALHRCCLLLIADVSTDVTIKSHRHFSHSNQMTNSHTNEATQGNEDERNSVITRTPEFYTDLVFKSIEDLKNWVQNVGRSLGLRCSNANLIVERSGSSLRLSLFPTPQFSSRVVPLPPSGAPLLHATALALHRCGLLLVADVLTDVTIKSHHHFSLSNQMANSHTNDATRGNGDERNSVINRTPEFYTDLLLHPTLDGLKLILEAPKLPELQDL